jgi:hypothetical protein
MGKVCPWIELRFDDDALFLAFGPPGHGKTGAHPVLFLLPPEPHRGGLQEAAKEHRKQTQGHEVKRVLVAVVLKGGRIDIVLCIENVSVNSYVETKP